jgi:diaminopimelate decarboxylase
MTFPASAKILPDGAIEVGGVSVAALAEKFGTPLYVVDEETLRQKCREYRLAFQHHYPNASFVYASKALSTLSVISIIAQEHFGVDVSSGGELYTAIKAGVNPQTIYFHGNSKSLREIKEALKLKVGRFVVDNFEELTELDEQARKQHATANILVRLNPGVEAHTHEFIQTGQTDSKFGFPQADLDHLITAIKSAKNLVFIGVHAHIGSQILDPSSFAKETEVLIGLAAKFNAAGLTIAELNIGGGIGIGYLENEEVPPIEEYAKAIAAVINEKGPAAGIGLPKLILEPGRSVVGEAGLTIYRVGAVKEVPGIRRYVVVDGGMSDNPRPIWYGAKYTVLANQYPPDAKKVAATVAGRFCESGDILFKDIMLPEVKHGDLLAAFCTGAYNYAMASNYNRVPRPAMVLVNNGQAKLIVKRESYKDLVRNDILI